MDDTPHPDYPSSWVKFRPSLCHGCQAGCCTLPVEVSPSDLTRMELISEDEARGSLKKPARRLMEAGVVRYFRARWRIFTLEQREDGSCLYLGPDRQCTIYEKRPDVCRQFPQVGPRPGFCPAKKK